MADAPRLGFHVDFESDMADAPRLGFRVEFESDMADAPSERMEQLLQDVSERIEQFLRQRSIRSELPPPTQDERPQKEKIENMLRDLLSKNSEKLDNGGWLDVLHSERYKKEVNEILSLVERMRRDNGESCDVVSSNDEILRELGEEINRLADSQSLLRKCDEKENSKSWLTSTCLPLAPDSYTRRMHLERQFLFLKDEVEVLLSSGMRKGKRGGVASSNGVMEEARNVLSLLSWGDKSTLVSQTAGVEPMDTLVSKYVLVCCIAVPVLVGSIGFQSLLNLCEELSRRGDVKMVMVARMNILADTAEVFNHSFSGFPNSCLAVPYEDWERRERIWKLLNCCVFEFKCFFYDTNGLYSNSFCVDDYEIPFGADAFPFTEKMIMKARRKQEQLVGKELVTFLKPYENSPVVVEEFNGKQERRILDVIKNKHVGLYVCCEGSLIPLLHDLYKKCKEKKKELEIVVLYAPRICPRIFKEKIDVRLREQNTRGWWCLPFNNSVSLRCRPGFSNFEDALIIAGPDGKISHTIGAYHISLKGIPDVYPFTREDREAVIEMQMGQEIGEVRLKSLLEGHKIFFQGNNPSDIISGDKLLRSKKIGEVRLMSLLEGHQHFFRGNNPSDIISADMLLHSKKIIIFMGKAKDCYAGGISYDIFQRLVDHYKVKNGKEEFEVVFIEYPGFGQLGAESADGFSRMPWYIQCPFNGGYTFLARELTELFYVQSLVVFGEDGHICSAGAASGMAVHDDCKLKFLELKAKRTYRFIIYKIEEKLKQVMVEKVGEPAEGYDEFAACLPADECRYAVFDFDFMTEEGVPKSRIFFVAWSPDTSRVRSKMIYASSKGRFKRELDGIQIELQATDPTEIGLDVIKSRV